MPRVCSYTTKLCLGPVDATKTKLEKQSSVVVCREKENFSLTIQPRDAFQNLCSIVSESSGAISTADLHQFYSVVYQVIPQT